MDMMDILMAKALSEGGGGGSQVIPNPEGEATETLEKLSVNDTVYGIPSGASVVPNPEGEATADLTKLGIDDTVYGIPKELPAVTGSDNGNILQVIEGAWGKAAMGKDVAVYELEVFGAGRKLKNDKHVSDILNDIQSGKNVLVKDTAGGMFAGISLITDGKIEFSSATILTDNKTSYIVRYSAPTNPPETINTFSVKYVAYDTSKVLPNVDSSDNNKVLTVVNGAWTKAAPSGGDIVVYTATQRNNSSYCDLDNGKTTTDIYNDIVAGKIVAIYVKNGLPKIFFYNEYHYGSSMDYYVFSSAYIHDNKPYIAKMQLTRQDMLITIMEITEYRLALYSDIPTT